ncbi:siderophore ABC transporter substrate-binding protein [Stutzerimonas azotifigens]|uniref:siderophore ABC transporter substrate-binding protein n=1 Tax=Stutzerimonas azotifigens TaxID=291995 RepID=UPI0003F7C6C7|nr:siderophore ABC transporter substrate-binding protein [Stutzerimonas azotifigens]
MNTTTGTLNRLSRLAVAAAIAAAAGLAQAQSTVPVEHAKGTTEIKADPQKIVVLDTASLDTLDTLGIEVTAVPETNRMPPVLAKYDDKQYARAGTLFEPDYEAIKRIAPDLVIVGGRSGDKYAEVAKVAPAIDLTVDPKNLVGSVRRNTETLAMLFGKQAEAEQKLKALDDSIAAVRLQAAEAGTGLVVLTTGGRMSAYGPGSRFGLVHDVLGVQPAATDLEQSNRGQSIDDGFIQKTNPDWLFVIDRDAAVGREGKDARKMLDNALVHQTTAWQKGQVVYLNAANWYVLGSAGLTALQQNIDQLAEAFAKAR